MSHDPARRCAELINTDGARAFIAFFEQAAEREKENLVNQRGPAADESRGFIKKTRQALNSVRVKPADRKGSPYTV